MTTLRSLTERLTGPLKFPRTLPNGQRIWVSPSAGLRFLFRRMKDVDPQLLDSTKHVQPGDVVWDIGANLGLFTFSVAQKASLVLAVEPDVAMVHLLQKSGGNNVRVLQLAVGERVGSRRFHIARRSRAANHLEGYGSTQTGGTSEVKEIQAVTLDWLAERFPLPNVIKIDVEGAEREVFKGCSFLSRHRPVIICEVYPDSVETITDLLHVHRYQIYDGDTPVSRAGWNTIAIPA